MNGSTDDPRQPPAVPGEEDIDVARVLRLAAGPSPSPQRRAAAFERVHAEWRAAVVAPPAPAPAPTPQPVRRSPWWIALAASVTAAAIGVALVGGGPGVRPERVAVAQVVSGPQATLQGAGLRDRLFGREHPLVADAVVRSGDSLATGEGTSALLQVGAQLSLRLAPRSRLRFDAPGEVTLLGGQVYVDSDARDGGQTPLAIATAHAVVRHVGTRYLVRLQPGGLDVAVREGRVQMSPVTTSQGVPAPVEAGAGERLRLAAGTGMISRERIAPTATDWAWLGRIPAPVNIDGESLERFLEWYAAESGRRVEFGAAARDARLGSVRLRGSVAGLSPDQALDSVAAIADLVVRRSPDYVTIDAAGR